METEKKRGEEKKIASKRKGQGGRDQHQKSKKKGQKQVKKRQIGCSRMQIRAKQHPTHARC